LLTMEFSITFNYKKAAI